MRSMIDNVLIGSLVALPVLLASSAAHGQALGSPTAFTPEIGVVQSGTSLDVQATVSADEKYVTLTMRPQLSTLLALRSFTFQQGNAALGFVGMPETAAGGNSATAARNTARAAPWPSAHSSVPILQRQGMIRVSKPAPPGNDVQQTPSGK